MVKKFTWEKIDDAHYGYYGENELGYLEYWRPWKKWVWNQMEDIVMSIDCLQNVIDKLRALEVQKR
ncbi:hypothetical protein LCGC14_2567770 [marine sediment metagenome]|uniref:Uncharacterized protein n=1 Tax=marine sediment metagenome TaxID=412755 RepID=A0A0F9CU87_9ZZZZ